MCIEQTFLPMIAGKYAHIMTRITQIPTAGFKIKKKCFSVLVLGGGIIGASLNFLNDAQ